ncbi:retinol dehydrogenase 12-like [Homarus americanus]|uniref:retinol dehydrogenase 12-like n=1 Tax=Homarus americanus TaxID=6706 RepID=UPI001C452C3C|nr:retinol dehydrogenase 12-like [Homarus americanus]
MGSGQMYLNPGVQTDSRLWFPILLWTMGVVGVVVGVVVGLYIIRKYRERKWGQCKSKRRMEGKIVVITGANSGIGKETARDLASRGAIVILACRNRLAALEAVRDIRTTTGDGDLIVMDLDLGDLASVRTFASKVLEKFSKIDVLINNAGVFIPPEERKKTKDGFEIHMGVNHLGHFLLTHLLLDRIQSTPSSRIVLVSSMLYKRGKIDFDNMDADKGWDKNERNQLYNNSKLANIFHSQELAKRLQGSSVGVFVLCPGFVYTGLMRYSAPKFNWIQKLCFAPIMFLFMRNAQQGSQTTIHSAVSEELDGVEWGFLRECKIDGLEEVAQDSVTAARLWDVSMTMVGEKTVGVAEGEGELVEEQGVVLEEEGVFVEEEDEEEEEEEEEESAGEDEGVLVDEGITLEDDDEEDEGEEPVVAEKEVSEGEPSEGEGEEAASSSAEEDDEALVDIGSLDDDKRLLLQHQDQKNSKSK